MTEDNKNFDFQPLGGAFRNSFCQRHFKDCLFDTKIFNIADQILIGYNGGYWEYINWKGTPLFRLKSEERVTLRNPHSGEEYEMDCSLAGMIITLYALGLALETGQCKDNDEMIDLWHVIKELIFDYANEVGDSDAAFKMID